MTEHKRLREVRGRRRQLPGDRWDMAAWWHLPLVVSLVVLGAAGCGGGDATPEPAPPAGPEPTPPRCRLDPLPPVVSGTILVGHTLFDAPAAFVDLLAEFSTDGGQTWSTATEGQGGEGTSDLEASAGGNALHFAWDTLADFPLAFGQEQEDVTFRIIPFQGALVGDPCVSLPVTVRPTPVQVQLGAIVITPGQNDVQVRVFLSGLAGQLQDVHSVDLELAFDPTRLRVLAAEPGAAALGATATFTVLGPDRVRVRLEGAPALADGEGILLRAEATCARPVLPDATVITCEGGTVEDTLGNELPSTCDGSSVTLIDGGATFGAADAMLGEGAVGAHIELGLDEGLPPIDAGRVTVDLAWDPAQLSVTGAIAGLDAPAGTLVDLGGNPAAGSARLTIDTPAMSRLSGDSLARLVVDVLAPAPATLSLDLANLQVSSARCPDLEVALDPAAEIQVTGLRTLTSLRAVRSLGSRGSPALVPGSAGPRNPKGNWFPLNSGEFTGETHLPSGGNPVLFFSLADTPLQLVLEAGWTRAPNVTDVAAAVNADGATVYRVLSGAGNVDVSTDGLLSPLVANACTTFEAEHLPNGVTAFGAPLVVRFSACVDLAGIDGATRGSGLLEAGGLDADLPGMPLGDRLPAVGGSFDVTVYASSGGLAMGDYEVRTSWDPAVLDLQRTVGMTGFLPPLDPTLGGPTAVDAGMPGEAIASHTVASPAYSGIFDIWTLRMDVLAPGQTPLRHDVVRIRSRDMPPLDIGLPTPRLAPAATTELVLP